MTMNPNGHTAANALTIIEKAVESVSLAELPAFLGQLEKVKALGWARMITGPQNGHEESGLLTIKEVAQRLKVSEYRAYELARQGELKALRLGKSEKRKSVRVRPCDLAEYLAKQGA